jgi:membrane protease subunit HflK
MAWNEPGGGGNRDPWSGKGGDQGPPDLDEVVKKLQDKLGGLFGGERKKGGGNGSGGGPSFGGGSSGKAFGGVGIIVAVVVVILLAIQSFYIIEPAERGVVKRFGAFLQVTEPGPHLKLPFIDEVVPVDVDKVHEFPHRAQMLTRDENIVDLVLSVQYRILDPADYLFQDADPENAIRGAMESALREVIGRSLLDEITTENRSGIAVAVQEGTRELMDLYRTGLIVLNINIQDAGPPEVVADAFADAIKAREDNVRLQNQAEAYANDVVPRARGAAARIIEDAKAHRAKVVAEADGESQRFLALLAEYQSAPGVTRERLYLDTMQDVLGNSGKVLIDAGAGGNNLTYLPLDKLLEQSPRRDTSTARSSTSSLLTPSAATAPETTPSRSRNFDRSGRTR